MAIKGWAGLTRVVAAIALALLLSGCSAIQQGAIQTGIEEIKKTNDTLAKTLIQSTCGMSLGAYHRLESPTDKQGADLLCGGTWGRPVTMEDLQRFLKAQ